MKPILSAVPALYEDPNDDDDLSVRQQKDAAAKRRRAAEKFEPAADEPEEPFKANLNVAPYRFAEEYVERFHSTPGGTLTMRTQVGGINYTYDDRRRLYLPIEPEVLASQIVANLRDAEQTNPEGQTSPVNLKPVNVSNLLKGLNAHTLMGGANPAAKARSMEGGVPFRNGWLDVETGEFVEQVGPGWFTTWRVPYDYEPGEWHPDQTPAWIEFLQSIGFTKKSGGEYGAQRYRLLRQIMALPFYSGRISKAPLLIGASRSGKGTILRLMSMMVGDEGSGATDIDALAGDFALEPLIGKRLVTIGDARFGANLSGRAKTRILSLTGGDALPVNRKGVKQITVVLPARLVIATNETPKFIEASNALAERFALLHFVHSFLGREDDDLIRRVEEELPGIVRWTLGGVADLRETGRLAETSAGRDAVQQMVEHGSQVRAFVEDRCLLEPDAWVSSAELREAYVGWADAEGEYRLSSKKFGIDLVDAFREQGVAQKHNPTGMQRGYRGIRLDRRKRR